MVVVVLSSLLANLLFFPLFFRPSSFMKHTAVQPITFDLGIMRASSRLYTNLAAHTF